MKKLLLFFAGVLLTGVTVSASSTTNSLEYNSYATTFVRGYGNSFIFVEQGIEFAVFPDGQFDFNVMDYAPRFSAYADFGGVSISFNTGHSYDAYVQYDDYGAVVQIENVPIYYDYYGRIVRAGSVRINYNSYGYVTRVGGLYVHYNTYNRFSHCTGFINVYNRRYVYRPWHTYYAAPLIDFCIVFNKPYRRYYKPVRHTFYRPYRDNYRPRVSYTASRRGNSVAQHTSRRSDRYIQNRNSRRGNDVVSRSRRLASLDQNARSSRNRDGVYNQSRRSNEIRSTRNRTSNTVRSTPNRALKGNDKIRTQKRATQTIKRKNTTTPRVKSKSRNSSKPRVTQRSSKQRKQVVKPGTQRNKSSKANAKRTSERIRHKSRSSSNKKSNARSNRLRQ